MSDNGKQIYADDIAKITISRQFPGIGGKSRRVKMSRKEFQLQNGGEFVINPFETTEDQLEELFGGGEYYIQAYSHDGGLLPCGRTIHLPGEMKPGVRETYLNDALVASVKSLVEDDVSGTNGAVNPILDRLLTSTENQVKELRQQLDQTRAAQALQPRGADDEVVRGLRSQMDVLVTNHRSEIDRLSKTIEEERAALRRNLDAAQEEYNSKRRSLEGELQRERDKRDAEMQAERQRHAEELARLRDEHRRALEDERKRTEDERLRVVDERKRADTNLEDERRRRLSEVDDTTKRYKSRIDDLERDLSATRLRLEKQITDLMKENIDLRRDLADTPIPEPEPERGPDGRPGKGDPSEPLWYKALNQWGPPVAAAVRDYAKNSSNAMTQAGVQRQMPARFLPPQPPPAPPYVPPQPPPYIPPPAPVRSAEPLPAPPPPPVRSAEPPPPPPISAPPSPSAASSAFTYGPAETFDPENMPNLTMGEDEGGGWATFEE